MHRGIGPGQANTQSTCRRLAFHRLGDGPIDAEPGEVFPPQIGIANALGLLGHDARGLLDRGASIGPVRLGMNAKEVEAVLGKKSSSKGRALLMYHRNAVEVDYRKGKAVFIQVSRDSGICVEYDGVSVFDTKDSQLLKLLSKKGTLESKSF